MPAADLPLLIEAAREAGRIARSFNGAAKSWNKPGDAGPVTEADLAVNDMLEERLLAARPGYGWLSEETQDTPERLAREKVFIVDPIDGTRSFVEGDDSWAHSLAVAENGIVTAGVVFLPMRGQDTPTPQQLAAIAGGPFQSMSCLTACARSPRFCAISWDKTVAWCSYTSSRAPLRALTYAGLQTALRGLGLSYCGDGLVRVRARAGDPRVSRNTDDAGISP